jgi:hypothetical protein
MVEMLERFWMQQEDSGIPFVAAWMQQDDSDISFIAGS